jgi:hypothetical protein
MDPSRKRRVFKIAAFALPGFLILCALLVWAVSYLWNGLMPSIFGLGTITYWQALRLMVLCWILFRGPRGPHPGRMSWEMSMRRRWQRMTPAEREEFVRGLNTRYGGTPPAGPTA